MARRAKPSRDRQIDRPKIVNAAPRAAPAAAPKKAFATNNAPGTAGKNAPTTVAATAPSAAPMAALETAPETAPTARPDPPLPPPLAVLSVLVFTAVAVLSAGLEVVLVPLRAGTVVVPVSVALALVGNVAIPVLSRRAVPATVAAVLPAVAWVATVLVLAQARPEGDVLLIGTAPLVYVTYALLGVGILAAMVTVVRGQAHAFAGR